jgi:hypothetical protein
MFFFAVEKLWQVWTGVCRKPPHRGKVPVLVEGKVNVFKKQTNTETTIYTCPSENAKSVRGSTLVLHLPQPVLHTLTRRGGRAKMHIAVAGVSGLPPLWLAASPALLFLWHAGPGSDNCSCRCPLLSPLPPQPFSFVCSARLRRGSRRCRQPGAGVMCGSQRQREDVWGWRCPRERCYGEHPHTLLGQ